MTRGVQFTCLKLNVYERGEPVKALPRETVQGPPAGYCLNRMEANVRARLLQLPVVLSTSLNLCQ